MNPWEEGPAGRALAFFYDICRIPRGSGNEKAVADYVTDVNTQAGMAKAVYQIALGNNMRP